MNSYDNKEEEWKDVQFLVEPFVLNEIAKDDMWQNYAADEVRSEKQPWIRNSSTSFIRLPHERLPLRIANTDLPETAWEGFVCNAQPTAIALLPVADEVYDNTSADVPHCTQPLCERRNSLRPRVCWLRLQ